MPQKFIYEGSERLAFQLSSEEYADLQKKSREERNTLTSPITGLPVHLQRSPRKLQYVAHYSGNGMGSEGESPEHRNTKIKIFKALESLGYKADLEHRIPLPSDNPDECIIADTIAFFDDDRIPPLAIEIQNSAQTAEIFVERTQKYWNAGYGVMWLQRHNFNWDEIKNYPALPVTVKRPNIEYKDDNYLDIDWSNASCEEISLEKVIEKVCDWHKDKSLLTHDPAPTRACLYAIGPDMTGTPMVIRNGCDDDYASDMQQRLNKNTADIRYAEVDFASNYIANKESCEAPLHILPLSNPDSLLARTETGEWMWIHNRVSYNENLYPFMSIVGVNALSVATHLDDLLPVAENKTVINQKNIERGRNNELIPMSAPVAFEILATDEAQEKDQYLAQASYSTKAIIRPVTAFGGSPKEVKCFILTTSMLFGKKYFQRGKIVCFSAQAATAWNNSQDKYYDNHHSPSTRAAVQLTAMCPVPIETTLVDCDDGCCC